MSIYDEEVENNFYILELGVDDCGQLHLNYWWTLKAIAGKVCETFKYILEDIENLVERLYF